MFNLCNSIRLGHEPESLDPSITQVAERLNIATLLQRAEMGIVDLTSYQRSRNNDVRDQDVSAETIENLMNRPSSVLDRTFGFSREDGAAEFSRHRQIAASNRVKNDPSPAPSPAPAPDPVPAPAAAPAPAPVPASA